MHLQPHLRRSNRRLLLAIRKPLTALREPVEAASARRITFVDAADAAVLALLGPAGALAAVFDTRACRESRVATDGRDRGDQEGEGRDEQDEGVKMHGLWVGGLVRDSIGEGVVYVLWRWVSGLSREVEIRSARTACF